MYANEPNRRRSSCPQALRILSPAFASYRTVFCLRSPAGFARRATFAKWWVAAAMAEPSALRLLRLVQLPQL
jgi:hypothetical protein